MLLTDQGLLRSALCLAAAAGCSAGAHAAYLGHQWVEVDNGGILGGGEENGLGAWRTFDLFLNVTAPVVVLDSGYTQSSGPNSGIFATNAEIYQDAMGDALPPNPGLFGTFPELEFDSYVAMGDLNASNISLQGAPSEGGFVFDSQQVLGTWFAAGGMMGMPDGEGNVFAGRFTARELPSIPSGEGDGYLGGELFVFFMGDDIGTVVDIDNAFLVPSPGAAALAFAALGVGVRRRRD